MYLSELEPICRSNYVNLLRGKSKGTPSQQKLQSEVCDWGGILEEASMLAITDNGSMSSELVIAAVLG